MKKVKKLSDILTRNYVMDYTEVEPRKIKITKLEAEMLYRIMTCENDGVGHGYSEFERNDGSLTNQDKGVLSSLFQKGLIIEGSVSQGMGYHPETGEWSSEIIIPTWTSGYTEFDFLRFPEQTP
ncbi:MAG: hypothetical protein Unbinned5858contig1001_29 [Prokaryotic dsDNA virus sp.]|nr:MAG: hypothetical protein Unbinned5858contig1001_29 [Prokaryotic dsDNA virus sp.]|tara:strand:+ start:204 stop:575 length:372 start_codon:yes stop_codon:yes gene_type:complete